MRDTMIRVENLYLGIIQKKKNAYLSKENKILCDFIFEGYDEKIAEESGIATIVHLEDGIYKDVLYNQYRDELLYKIDTYNNKGIKLSYIEPFLCHYPNLTYEKLLRQDNLPDFLREKQAELDYLILPNSSLDGEVVCLNDQNTFFAFEDHYWYQKLPFNLKHYFMAIVKKGDAYLKMEETKGHLPNGSSTPFTEWENVDVVPTVVRKVGNVYHDVLYSVHFNDLVYAFQKSNEQDIYLEHLEPFTDYYLDLTMFPQVTQRMHHLIDQITLQSQLPYTLFKNTEDEGVHMALHEPYVLQRFYDHYLERNKTKKKTD